GLGFFTTGTVHALLDPCKDCTGQLDEVPALKAALKPPLNDAEYILMRICFSEDNNSVDISNINNVAKKYLYVPNMYFSLDKRI
ncbi:MAG: hypothetical protein JSU90_03285, partial [Nitrospiraceae bacterium]